MSVNSLSCLYVFDEMMVMCCVYLQDGDNALHIAAFKGHSDVANLVLQKKPDLIMQKNDVSKQLYM